VPAWFARAVKNGAFSTGTALACSQKYFFFFFFFLHLLDAGVPYFQCRLYSISQP
jgi:hypothetical protein